VVLDAEAGTVISRARRTFVQRGRGAGRHVWAAGCRDPVRARRTRGWSSWAAGMAAPRPRSTSRCGAATAGRHARRSECGVRVVPVVESRARRQPAARRT
jgi:hypothetical protein